MLANEEMGTNDLHSRILNSADSLTYLYNKVHAGKWLNVHNALTNSYGAVLSPYYEDDFDVHGYQPTQSGLIELYASAGDVLQMAAGFSHTLALKEDGTVWAWGKNEYGQCGNGTTSSTSLLTQVVGLTNVVYISAAYDYSLALKSDGTVWAWGYNCNGQLGDGSTTDRTTPVQVSGLTGITAIAGGSFHSLALKSDGTVWAWGNNVMGQLGNSSFLFSKTTPGQVSGLTGITAIAGGSLHSLALKSDGTVWAWGYNSNGRFDNFEYTIKNQGWY